MREMDIPARIHRYTRRMKRQHFPPAEPRCSEQEAGLGTPKDAEETPNDDGRTHLQQLQQYGRQFYTISRYSCLALRACSSLYARQQSQCLPSSESRRLLRHSEWLLLRTLLDIIDPLAKRWLFENHSVETAVTKKGETGKGRLSEGVGMGLSHSISQQLRAHICSDSFSDMLYTRRRDFTHTIVQTKHGRRGDRA